MSRVMGLGVVALLSVACGGMAARAALKGPLTDRCADTGLRSCDHFAEGALLYVEGDNAKGMGEIKQGIAANEPAQLRAYAKKLKSVSELPGVSSYAGQLAAIASLLESGADEQATLEPQTGGGGSAVAVATVAPRESERRRAGAERSTDDIRTASSIPATDSNARACPPALMASLGGNGACSLVRQYIGPLVVTDLYASGDCPDDMFVLAGQPEEPKWLVLGRVNTALSLQGAQLLVGPDQPLFIGARSRTSSPLQRDARCSITWSGWRSSHFEAGL